MGLHQIIYTSCMRGIQGVNDGQQVYSYDQGFQEAGSDGIKSLFSYQLPALPPGVVMTEELAPAMPRSFTYRKLPGGGCALALSTYLGRDYMGSDGRFGNHLSHVVAADDPAELGGYPCEFFGSPMLRDHMEYEEVNNPERPDYLPAPVAEKGYVVDLDTVADFLAQEERMEAFKNMLWAALSFETARKRLLICDQPENIILWIGAVEYVLPLKTALDISFTTYEFDPSLSPSRICGVRPEGTRYQPGSGSQHFVFDFFENSFPSFERDEEFCEFVDTALSFSYESLQDFHRFLEEGYTYRGADLRLCAAYRLYTLLSDGMGGMDSAGLSEALAFGEEFALPGERDRITDCLLDQAGELLGAQEEVFLVGAGYLFRQLGSASLDGSRWERALSLLADRVLGDLAQCAGEEEFRGRYGRLGALCAQNLISIPREMADPANRDKLLSAMEQDPDIWKIGFVVDMAAGFAKEERPPVSQLMPEAPLGQTLCGLVRSVYSSGGQNGFYLVTRILEAFGWDGEYLANMALNLEGVLLDLPGGQEEAQRLWRHFTGMLEESGPAELERACRVLAGCGRFDQVYVLCVQAMSRAAGPREAQEAYARYRDIFPRGREAYGPRLDQAYYRKLSGFRGEGALPAKAELLRGLLSRRQEADFVPALVKEVAEGLPLEKPSPQRAQWLQEIYRAYSSDGGLARAPEKLRLLWAGMALEQCRTPQELEETLAGMREQGLTVRTGGGGQEEYEAYVQWVLGPAAPLCRTRRQMAALAGVLQLTGQPGAALYREWAKLCVKESKGDKDCRLLVDFLSVLFQYGGGDPLVCREAGRALGRLNKQRSAELDSAMLRAFRTDPEALALWDQLRAGAAAGGGSLREGLNNLTSLFKRRQ